MRVGSMYLVPIDENKRERPCGQNPSDRSPYADESELFLRVLDIGKGDGVGNGVGRDVEQAMNHHETEKRPKSSSESQGQNRDTAHKVTESEKSFRGEMAVRILIAKKHAHYCGDGERV